MPHILTKPLSIAIGALVVILCGLSFSAHIQAGHGVSVEAVRFRGQSGAEMRALLFKPRDATAAHRHPAILAVHGYLNSAEMQGNFATEFARRGYVVLAPDQRGHGGSDPKTFADGFGGPNALRYLRSLPFVDRDNIGLEGHSMGGWTVLAAAAAVPNGYRSLVLEGSSVGAPFAPAGTASFPRNLLVVYGLRDEFGELMWGPQAPLRTGATEKIMTTFGISAPVIPGRLYGDLRAGTGRMLLTPFVAHAWLHESRAGITPAIQWFARTLEQPRPLADDDQVWQWREAGAALALIAVPFFIAGAMGAAIRCFGIVRNDGPNATLPDPSRARVGQLVAFSLVPAIAYLPLAMLSEAVLGQNWLFRQTFSNQLAFWAVLCTLGGLASARFSGRPALPLGASWRGVVAAALAVGAGFAVVTAADALGHVNPSWWFITVRPLTPTRFRDFFLYLPFFTGFAMTSLYVLDSLRPLELGSTIRALLVASAAMSGGFVLFLTVQYGTLLLRGTLLLPAEGLRTIMAIGFVPMFVTVGVFGTLSRRWTGSVFTGGIAAGLFVTGVLTATQPIGV